LRAVIAQQLLLRADGKGRVAAYEVLVATPAVRSLIREQKTFHIPSAIGTGRKEGMQTIDQHLIELAGKGLITPAEAVKYADAPALMQAKAAAASYIVGGAPAAKPAIPPAPALAK